MQIGTHPPSDLVLTDKSYAEQQRIIADLMQRISQFGAIRQSEAQLLQALTIQQEEKNVVLSELDAWLSTHTADETLLSHFPATTELQALRTELIEASAKLKSVERFVKQAETGLKSNQTEQNKTDAQQSQLTEQLSQAETDLLNCLDGYELSALTELKSEQQERVQRFQELLNLATTYTKLADQGGGLFSLFKKNNLAVRTVDEITADIEATKTETAREENIKRALEQAIIREGLMKKMAPDRQHLHSGKPCPLCGSLQHPYLTQPPQLTNSKQALIDQQVKLKTLANRAARLQQELRITQKTNENNSAKQNELNQLRSRWLGLCNRLNVVEADLTIDNLKLMQQHLNDETFELNTVNGLLSRYQAQQTAIAKLKTRLEKNAELKQFLQTTAERYANDYQNYSEQQQALTKTVQTLTEAEHELALKVNEQLEQLGEKIPNKGKEAAFFDRLNNRRQTYQSYLDKRRYLLDELAVLDAKQQQCKAEIDRANQRMDEHVDTMHIEEQIAFQLQLIDKQQVLEEQQTQLAQQTAQLATLNAQLDQALSQSELKQRDELKQRLAQLDKIPTVQNRLQQRLSELSNANNVLSQSQQNLDALQTLLAAGPAQETLQETLHSKREQTEIALLEVQRIEKLLKEQHRLRQHYETALRMYQQQQQLASPILDQAELLKPESGHALRRHVQAQFIAQLLDKTNAILEKISRRYYLRQAPSEHGLALDIEDTYQNNSRRPPKSLSGGESFIVSLALALGLSELASNGKSIDTLFLDEGFGNLDSETLYTVISTLDKLRQQGKSIGIISHVEAVQKRIKAQLQVVKKANGYGELKKAS
ncbi:SbcC/MukB-like Walker B domain-containing protein [Methylocucumis oryzae]|uniref:SbcC/MukB-like Walker B domain-containing protein n=1 Tax=Methylocucumis oryzae TaxID=1632867 RepID=UPI0006976A63|nr:SbcC/MukB-like Walker B domain-containing protein [Methylocucumis oryzae]